MSRPFGCKNKKPYPVTPELLDRLKRGRDTRTANAYGQGVQIRIDARTAARLRKMFPVLRERHDFIKFTLNAKMLELEKARKNHLTQPPAV